MVCNKYDDKLSFYVKNELSLSEQNEIEEHLKSCHSCSMKVSELGTLFDGISEIEDIEPPEDFHQKLLLRAGKELWAPKNNRVFQYGRLVKYASVAAVLALCVFSATHLGMLKGAKKDMALADNRMTSSAASSSKNEYGSQEIASDVQNDRKTDSIKDGSTAKSAKEAQPSQPQTSIAESSTIQGMSSNNTAVSKNTSTDISGSADVSANAGSVSDRDILADAKAQQPPESAQTEAKKSVLTSPQLLQIQEQSKNINIKTNSIEAAVKLIDEQAQKINTRAVHVAVTTGQTTQESTYSAFRSFAAPQTAPNEDTVSVEVKKENEAQFKALLEQAFGKDNISYETSDDNTAETIKFTIKITL